MHKSEQIWERFGVYSTALDIGLCKPVLKRSNDWYTAVTIVLLLDCLSYTDDISNRTYEAN